MEVILLERVAGLGNMGAVVKVKDGYGRNFLLPRKKALRATPDSKAFYEKEREKLAAAQKSSAAAAEVLAKKLNGESVMLIRQAGEDGRLFGSVTVRDIAAALKEKGIDVNRQVLSLAAPIKYIGIFDVFAQLHAEVQAKLSVNVARSESEGQEAYREGLAPDDVEEEAAADAAPADKADDEGAEA